MNALELQFITESRELLEGIGSGLLKLEKHGSDADELNSLFRQVHTLKGNCGLFDELSPLGVALHAAEDCLDLVREGKARLDLKEIDLLMEVMDYAVSVLDAWEAGRFDPAASLPLAKKLAERLKSDAAGSAPASLSESVGPAEVSEMDSSPAWFMAVLDHLPQLSGRLVCGTYTPEPECFFKGEDPLRLVLETPALEFVQIERSGTWEEPESFDFYRAQVLFRFVSSAPLHEVKRSFEYVADQLEWVELTHTPACLPKQLRERLFKLWQAQARMLSMSDASESSWQGRAHGAVATVQAIAKAAKRETWATGARLALTNAIQQDSLLPLQQWFSAPPAELAGTFESTAIADEQPCDPLSSVESVEPAQDMQVLTEVKASAAPSMLKVSREKVDHLMELIGELVVAKNSLPFLAGRAETEFSCRALGREIKANHSVLNRIAEEMQDAIMQIRMLPVSTVFQRFPRLVRDLSKRLGKQVHLEISGEETEADKNMIEALGEPLIHLLRNCLDHGIELPELREQAGKSKQGLIAIHAWHDADRVHISIRDDGAGIDPQRLKAKAIEKGLLPPEKLEPMSDRELLQLIFMPGFSTANSISDVSGRGVGMDVVRTAIQRIGGHVDLQSTIGAGTTLTLSIPLSMAVNKVMLIQVAGQSFGVPMESVIETVRVSKNDLHRIQDQMAVVLRGRILPLLSLHQLLGLSEQPLSNADGELAVLVCRMGGETVGLLVDCFDAAIDILLRPLDGLLSGMRQYAGSALLGDGTVLLILNLTEMISCQ